MVHYSFPVLSTAEIVSNLSQLEIATVKPDAISNPTLDFLISLYTAFVTFLDPLGDDPAQMDFATLELLESPDQHVHSVRIMNLYYKVKDLVNAACSMNFTLRDLISPQRDRTIHFISGILNLCLYRQDKLNVLHPMVEKVGDCEQQCIELEARIAELSKEIEDHEEARRMEQPKVQEVEVEVKELRQTIQSLNKQQLSLKSSFRTIKDKTLEINDKISSADFELVQSVQENAKLRSKIVQSPDKLQRALDEKKSVRMEATNAERLAMQCFQERTCTLEVYSKVHKKLSKRLAHMQNLQEQVNSAKAIDKDVKVLKARMDDEAVLDMSLGAKLVDRQGKLDQLEETRKAVEKERDFKHTEAVKELNAVKSEIEAKLQDLEQRERRVEAMVVEGDKINSTIGSVRESGAATRQQLADKCQEIVSEVCMYSDAINGYMEGIENL